MLPTSMDDDLEGGAKEAMKKLEGRKVCTGIYVFRHIFQPIMSLPSTTRRDSSYMHFEYSYVFFLRHGTRYSSLSFDVSVD